MPERIKVVHQQPSSQIVWIKPLPGPDTARAQDFLERVAAIAHPIMKSHHLRITSLEEHEPNREFIGRNFNAGEIIQLVLKSQRTGQWLPFRMVQMVMMHELAHCLQMSHGKEFWKVNDGFKGELRGLWAKGYTGEGMWGRGRTLLSGDFDSGLRVSDGDLPQHLCGGAYRSRRRRKRRKLASNGPGQDREETWAEKKQRRIEKKFGINGSTLGQDENTRIRLERGQKVKGQPRVANSGRGRELRAAAALARFGQQKEEEAKKVEARTKEEQKMNNGNSQASEDDSEAEYEEADDGPSAINQDGTEMLDPDGHGLVRVCASDEPEDRHVKQEMDELHNLDELYPLDTAQPKDLSPDSPTETLIFEPLSSKGRTRKTSNQANTPNATPNPAPEPTDPGNWSSTANAPSCPVCSMENDPSALLCTACSHVLNTSKVTRYWRCLNDICESSQYVNTADSAFCGVCGGRRPEHCI